MSGFQLDTSGCVAVDTDPGGPDTLLAWGGLTPFTQGYVEAMFASVLPENAGDPVVIDPRTGGRHLSHSFAFSDLAPATLARIIEDCEKYAAAWPRRDWRAEAGRLFWQDRNDGHARAFPPLTPYLGDDGKVYLRESA